MTKCARRNHFVFNVVVGMTGFSSLFFLSAHMTHYIKPVLYALYTTRVLLYFVAHKTTLTLVSKHLHRTTFIYLVHG